MHLELRDFDLLGSPMLSLLAATPIASGLTYIQGSLRSGGQLTTGCLRSFCTLVISISISLTAALTRKINYWLGRMAA